MPWVLEPEARPGRGPTQRSGGLRRVVNRRLAGAGSVLRDAAEWRREENLWPNQSMWAYLEGEGSGDYPLTIRSCPRALPEADACIICACSAAFA